MKILGFDLGDGESAVTLLDEDSTVEPRVLPLCGRNSLLSAVGVKNGRIVIGEEASVTGQIHADHVIINGRVKGPVHALELLELQPKARIEGDVSYKALEMHQGATIEGQLKPRGGALEDKPTLKLAANNL